MPEYRALRERHSMLELIRSPELAAQVTLMPVDAFGVDAAIVFSDILPPLVGMGLELDFVKGDGPRIGNPIASARDVDLLGTPPAEETMSGTLGAIALVRRELESRDIPVIGFAGAPFTLASYAIEGGTSKDFTKTKAFMLSEPAAWRRLLTKLATVQADYLLAQARAGAQALQVFDSWAGRALGREDYLRYVAPANRELYAAVARAGVPVINFSLGRERVPRGRGGVRRRRRRARLAASARRGVGARRLRPAGAGEPRPRLAARAVARAPSARSTTSSSAPPAVRDTSSTSVTASSRRLRSTTCAASSSTCASERRDDDRGARHGVRRAGVARGDSRLSRGHPRRAPDPAPRSSTRSRRTTARSADARRSSR